MSGQVPQTQVNYNNFNASLLRFSGPQKNAQGAQTVWVKYPDKRAVVQSPKVQFPFGITQYMGEGGHTLTVPLDDPQFREVANSIDNAVLDHVFNNADQLLGRPPGKNKTWSREVVEGKYNPLLKYPKKEDSTYPPSLRIKVASGVKFVDGNQSFVDQEYVTPRSHGIVKFNIGSVWFMSGGTFGISLYASVIYVLEKQEAEDDLALLSQGTGGRPDQEQNAELDAQGDSQMQPENVEYGQQALEVF